MTSTWHAWRARVRVYECDLLGHVNNAVYLNYLQQATAEAWASVGASAWALRTLAMQYLAPAYIGDDLEVRAWASGFDGNRVVCGYTILRLEDGRDLLRARASWALPDREPGAPFVQEWPSAPPELPGVDPLRLPSDRLSAHRYRWRHTVCSYELDASGGANPAQILRWVEEAKMVACTDVGWPLDRMSDADLMIVQIRHDSEFYTPLRLGQPIEVVSRICDLRLLKGTWCHEIYRISSAVAEGRREEELVATDYSAGAFLNCSGKPQPAPTAMLDALLQGTRA